MILMNGSEETNQTTGGNVTEKQIPWGKLHEIAEELKGEVKYYTCYHSNKKVSKKIVITYEES